MSFDALAPYGPIVDTSVRVATWNVWAQHGAWEERQIGIDATLVQAEPDLVLLTEAWATTQDTQAAHVASQLGFAHHEHVTSWLTTGDETSSGVAIASRWPITTHEYRHLLGGSEEQPGSAFFALIDGPRGPIQTFTVMLDYPLHASRRRQAQVHELTEFIAERTDRRHPTIVGGDFNAGPDSDEIRSLTGKTATPVEGLVFYDSWEIAGDGSAGYTWSNDNPLAAISMYPNRRFDYVFSAWPRLGAIGHPVRCERLGVLPPEQPQLSDHYGVVADLRY